MSVSRRAPSPWSSAGMNVYAASMLIPISVLLYTASGGLKATFTTSYAHTVIIYVALCLFTFTVYAGSKDMGIGSIDRVSSASLVLISIWHITLSFTTAGPAKVLEDDLPSSFLSPKP